MIAGKHMINCIVTSMNETVHYDKVHSVTIPSVSGNTQILPGHAEAFIALTKGNITLNISQRPKKVISIVQGECYTRDSTVMIIL